MKTFLSLVILLATSAAPQSFAQNMDPQGTVEKQIASRGFPPEAPPKLYKFDLDFAGGTPGELIQAIQKAMNHPLNAIIPNDGASVRLPPLKMKDVTVFQLFEALELATHSQRAYYNGAQRNPFDNNQPTVTWTDTSFGFRTSPLDGPISNESIWYFSVKGNIAMPKISRFFLLTPYLNRGLTVDDITTAIQTGWKMQGDSNPPTLSFHKETKLLIAVGDLNQLQTIDDVLKALYVPEPKPPARKSPPDTQAEH
jgi:hypothetical protein